jgi:hypothetical protein
VVVHGIRPTQWTDDAWQPGNEVKSSASWINNSLGLSSGRISHFHYPIHDAPPNALYVDGNEREAQNLLDGLVQMRLEFHEYSQSHGYEDVKVRSTLMRVCLCVFSIGPNLLRAVVGFAPHNLHRPRHWWSYCQKGMIQRRAKRFMSATPLAP